MQTVLHPRQVIAMDIIFLYQDTLSTLDRRGVDPLPASQENEREVPVVDWEPVVVIEARMQEKPETKLDCLLHVESPKRVRYGQGGIASPPWGEVPGMRLHNLRGVVLKTVVIA